MKVVIIGAGKVGYHLAKQLENKVDELTIVNHQENEVTTKLQKEKFNIVIGIENTPKDKDIYILAVKDSVISSVANQLKDIILADSLVVHTSGAIESSVLKAFNNYGVIYPLYSFTLSEPKIDWNKIPIFYISNNATTDKKIYSICFKLNHSFIFKITDEQKLKIHLLAVFANNFTNALAHSIYQLSQSEEIKDLNLMPLMMSFAIQTLQRIQHQSPSVLQTGPAVRKDFVSIEKHLILLNNYPDIKELYQCFTTYIQNIIANEQKH